MQEISCTVVSLFFTPGSLVDLSRVSVLPGSSGRVGENDGDGDGDNSASYTSASLEQINRRHQ